jgi:hypothetical protein
VPKVSKVEKSAFSANYSSFRYQLCQGHHHRLCSLSFSLLLEGPPDFPDLALRSRFPTAAQTRPNVGFRSWACSPLLPWARQGFGVRGTGVLFYEAANFRSALNTAAEFCEGVGDDFVALYRFPVCSHCLRSSRARKVSRIGTQSQCCSLSEDHPCTPSPFAPDTLPYSRAFTLYRHIVRK